VGKNALHWAMVEGPQAEQRQLRLLLNPEHASQADQGGNLPLHYAASSGVSIAVIVACALAFMDGLDWFNKTGKTPLQIAQLEGHTSIAAVLSGMQNRQRNDLHATLSDGLPQEAEQLRLLSCRPELAAQRDPQGNLPLHIAAASGASMRVLQECIRTFPDGPIRRNADGFFPYQLANENGHRAAAEQLASLAGKQLPVKPIISVLASAARAAQSGTSQSSTLLEPPQTSEPAPALDLHTERSHTEPPAAGL